MCFVRSVLVECHNYVVLYALKYYENVYRIATLVSMQ